MEPKHRGIWRFSLDRTDGSRQIYWFETFDQRQFEMIQRLVELMKQYFDTEDREELSVIETEMVLLNPGEPFLSAMVRRFQSSMYGEVTFQSYTNGATQHV